MNDKRINELANEAMESIETDDGEDYAHARCAIEHAIKKAIDEIRPMPPYVCTGSMQPVIGYGIVPGTTVCPICNAEALVLVHSLGWSIATHAYRPTA